MQEKIIKKKNMHKMHNECIKMQYCYWNMHKYNVKFLISYSKVDSQMRPIGAFRCLYTYFYDRISLRKKVEEKYQKKVPKGQYDGRS